MDSQLETYIIISMHFKVFFSLTFSLHFVCVCVCTPENFAGVLAVLKKIICIYRQIHNNFFFLHPAKITSVNNDEVSWEVH